MERAGLRLLGSAVPTLAVCIDLVSGTASDVNRDKKKRVLIRVFHLHLSATKDNLLEFLSY